MQTSRWWTRKILIFLRLGSSTRVVCQLDQSCWHSVDVALDDVLSLDKAWIFFYVLLRVLSKAILRIDCVLI